MECLIITPPGRYSAHVRMSSTGDLIKLDQDDMETVIPSAGGHVLVINGAYRGARARLQAIAGQLSVSH